MEYRAIGNTGMEAGIIGLGTEHLDGKPYQEVEQVIRAALDQGINMMDLFMPGKEIRSHIGKALGSDRKKMMIQGHIGSTDINEQYDQSRDLDTCKRYFDELLTSLNTDYIDFGMLFFIDKEEDFNSVFDGKILPYAQDLKKQGVIRAIGASSHNPVIARKMVETGFLDLLMFSINPVFDMASPDTYVLDYMEDDKLFKFDKNLDPGRMGLYKLCEQKGVGITVMKTLGAGKLLSPEHSPFSRPLSVGQCIHYALTRPAVVSVMLGSSTAEEVAQGIKYLSLSEEERDYSAVVQEFQGSFKGNCVYCNHCLPCPERINVAEVNKYLDIALLDEKHIPPSVAQHYRALPQKGGDCIGCGSCEKRCPFSVPVIKRMAKAKALFGA